MFTDTKSVPENPVAPYWTHIDIMKLFVLFFALELLFGALVTALGEAPTEGERSVLALLARTLAVVTLFLLHRHYRFWPSMSGFSLGWADFRRHFRTGLLWGLAVWALPPILIAVILTGVSLLYPDAFTLGSCAINLDIRTLALFSWSWLFVALHVTTLTPLLEEIMMRGILYPYLRQRTSYFTAVLCSSAVFALLHGFGLVTVAAFSAGIFLAILYEKKRALSACVIAHGVFNLGALFVRAWM